MNKKQQPINPGGRPRLSKEKKLKQFSIRFNDKQIDTVKRIGNEAVRKWIDSIKETEWKRKSKNS